MPSKYPKTSSAIDPRNLQIPSIPPPLGNAQKMDRPPLSFADLEGASLEHLLVTPKQSLSLDNAQPLDPVSFPNQPRAGTYSLPSTIQNIRHILQSYGVFARYNVIKKKTYILLPDTQGTTDNADNVAMTNIINLAALNGFSVGQVPSYVEAIADRDAFNPVAMWIDSKHWDGNDRLPEVCATITTRDEFPTVLKDMLIERWLLSAVAAALMDQGFRARGVLTFQGAQGIGKTAWVMSLVPDLVLRDMLVKVDHHLDGNNKDSILTAVSHWIVEIGELDSSFKKDIARLKGFLTSGQDKLRRPYARTDAEYARRTVFCATVNDSNFLVDSTGNTRWWTLPVTKINYKHAIDMQQVFAQLAVNFRKGDAEWWLNEHEEALLEQHNRDHRNVSAIREALMCILDITSKDRSGAPAMTATEVLRLAGYDKPTNPQCKDCGAILREHFGEPKKIQGIQKWRVSINAIATKSLPKHSTSVVNDDDY